MKLGPVSFLDCLVFCLLLAPQLIWHVGLVETAFCGLKALPFLVIEAPVTFLYERFFTPKQRRSPFVQQASPFEDFVIRCVRYAFAQISPKIGRVFFSKQVALPFLRWRMLRHGYLRSPIHWREYEDDLVKGIWLVEEPMRKPDVVLYYAHGGGFSMGSSYFYLEFLLSWLSMLREAGYTNPAIFALEYTLVPDASFPTQLRETIAGYKHVLTVARDPSIVCVGGDSAGGTLILSLLLYLADTHDKISKPALAVLISPWVTLDSPRHQNNTSDYLDAITLQRYGKQYAGDRVPISDPILSPGNCTDVGWWKRSSPSNGFFVTYGAQEVFEPEIRDFTQLLQTAGVAVRSQEEAGGIHAWPVASLFLSTSSDQRFKGLRSLVKMVRNSISPGEKRTKMCEQSSVSD